MEPNNNNEQEKKKLNDDVVVFMRKRSEHDTPRYTARLRTYVDLQRKRRRAAAARRHSEHGYQHEKKDSAMALRKKLDVDPKDKVDNSEHPGSEERMNRSLTTDSLYDKKNTLRRRPRYLELDGAGEAGVKKRYAGALFRDPVLVMSPSTVADVDGAGAGEVAVVVADVAVVAVGGAVAAAAAVGGAVAAAAAAGAVDAAAAAVDEEDVVVAVAKQPRFTPSGIKKV